MVFKITGGIFGRSFKVRGFTLIEMIAVLTIISILAAFAIPRFVDLSSEASQSSVTSVAAALSGASALNFAEHQASSSDGIDMTNCTDAANLLPGGTMPSGYTITSAAISDDAEVTCTLTHDDSALTANFLGVGVVV